MDSVSRWNTSDDVPSVWLTRTTSPHSNLADGQQTGEWLDQQALDRTRQVPCPIENVRVLCDQELLGVGPDGIWNRTPEGPLLHHFQLDIDDPVPRSGAPPRVCWQIGCADDCWPELAKVCST